MAEPDLTLIAHHLATLISEQRAVRDELRGVQRDQRSLRDEISLLREELRITTGIVRRFDDTFSMSVLAQLQALESPSS